MSDVTIIGLGYIGLPTSALIASKGISVLGVDINEKVVETINNGEIHIQEPDLASAVKKAVSSGLLKAATKPEKSSVYLIVVPTPFSNNYEPDLTFVESAIRSVSCILEEDDLIIIESTSPIGTTERMRDLVFEERPDLRDKIHFAYCPERVLPGNAMYELVHNDRVIGGVTEEATTRAIDFYKKFIIGELHRTDARTAEMCKLVENSSRDAQIAFANEISIIANKAGVDVWKLITLANKHPRVNILQPGCGVGGHCIAVDPYFLISKFPKETMLIAAARQVNNYKSQWVENQIISCVQIFKDVNQRVPVISILGLSFKADIDDLRESPALAIAKSLFTKYDKIYFVEPNIKFHDSLPLTNLGEALEKSDLIFVLVAHKEFKGLNGNNVISFIEI